MRVPPPVRSGSQIAIVAVSSAIAPAAIEIGCERLRSLFDLEPVVSDTCRRDGEWLRSHPEARVQALHDAFSSSSIGAVIAATGGDDQLTICEHLDDTLLRENPTRFFGISDNTVLHSYLSSIGLVSYYGGQLVPGLSLDSSLPAYTERSLRRALFGQTIGSIEPAEKWTDDVAPYGTSRMWESTNGWRWHPGDTPVVEGRSWGGCLEVIQWLLAADCCVPETIDGGVLLLETSEELPSATTVERVLRCLGERGLLAQFDAILVGRPKTRHRESRSNEERVTFASEQRQAILAARDRYAPAATVVCELPFGHTDPHVPIPVGGTIRIDTENREIICVDDRE